MIIGIDGNEANEERRVGSGVYAYEVLKHFAANASSTLQFTVYLKQPPLGDMPKENEYWKYVLVKPKRLWTQVGLPLYLFTHFPRPTLFFTPSHYAPRFSPVPTVISIMDLAYLHFPALFNQSDLYQLKEWTGYSVKNATKVFTISEASKRDIIKFYKVKEEDITVTYLGIKPTGDMKNQITIAELQKKYSFSMPYFLFVSTLQPRKNVTRLVQAFSYLQKKHPEVQLIIVGKKGWMYEEILASPKTYGVEDQVKFLDFVPNEDLPGLYSNAVAYVLPSLYEGFGLPVLEAMKFDCPVITSNISSLPEAGGDAVLYVDPLNSQDIAEKMEEMYTDKKVREELIKKGREQVKKFSWEKTAKQTLEVLLEVGKNA